MDYYCSLLTNWGVNTEQLPRESDTSALQELGMPLDTRTAGMPHLARKLFLTTMLPTRPIWRHCARAPHQASGIKIAPGTGRHWMRCCAWLPQMADSRLLRPNRCIFCPASWRHCQYITSLTLIWSLKSSLRKLDFPFCTIEALKRLLATCKTVSHKLPSLDPKEYKTAPNPAAFLTLSPKETELVLDIIDEFVFFTKSSLSKSRRLSADVQELHLLQIIIEFYQEHLAEAPESLTLNDRTGPLLMLTNYLFLDKNSKSLSNFTILALSLKNGPALHCIGLWLQQHLGHPSALQLTESVVENYISLVVDALDSLENVVEISPLFSLNFITSLTDLYNKSGKFCLSLFLWEENLNPEISFQITGHQF